MQKISKKEYNEAINKFIETVNKEIENWEIYKDSPEMQERVKRDTIAGLVKLPDLQKNAVITKLIEKGIFTKTEMDKALEIPIEERIEISVKDLLESDLPPEELIIGNGIMPTKGYMVIASREKAGKTLFGLNMALNLVSKTHFLESYPVFKKCKVLYIYFESNPRNLKDVLEKQIEGLSKLGIKILREDVDNFHVYNAKEKRLAINLKNDDVDHLKKTVDRFKPDVIILDPIGKIASFPMNKDENIKKFIDLMINIRDCFWILIHHYRKQGKDEEGIDPATRIRGSSNLANFAETIICIEPASKKLPANFKKVYFELRRKYEPIPLEIKYDNNYLNYEVVDITDLSRPERVAYPEIVEFVKLNFGGKASRRDIALACAQKFCVSEGRIDQLVAKAKKAGAMYKEEGKFGKWCVTDTGELPF